MEHNINSHHINCKFCNNKIVIPSIATNGFKTNTGYCYKCEISYESSNKFINKLVIWHNERPLKLTLDYNNNLSLLLVQNTESKKWEELLSLAIILPIDNLSINDYFNLVESKIKKLQVFK